MSHFFRQFIPVLVLAHLTAWSARSGQDAGDPGKASGPAAETGKAAAPERKPALAQQILGSWRMTKQQAGADFESIGTYRTDGTYTSAMVVRFLGTKTDMSIDGDWWVDEDAVKIKIKRTTHSLLLPKGKILEMTNVKIEDAKMTYLHDGNRETETRVAPPPEAGGNSGNGGNGDEAVAGETNAPTESVPKAAPPTRSPAPAPAPAPKS